MFLQVPKQTPASVKRRKKNELISVQEQEVNKNVCNEMLLQLGGVSSRCQETLGKPWFPFGVNENSRTILLEFKRKAFKSLKL